MYAIAHIGMSVMLSKAPSRGWEETWQLRERR